MFSIPKMGNMGSKRLENVTFTIYTLLDINKLPNINVEIVNDFYITITFKRNKNVYIFKLNTAKPIINERNYEI
jgi:hypothetical protein